jgi:hypothetical protein
MIPPSNAPPVAPAASPFDSGSMLSQVAHPLPSEASAKTQTVNVVRMVISI